MAWRAGGLLLALVCAGGPVTASEIWDSGVLVAARYSEPTERYPHGALGDPIEYGALELQYRPKGATYTIRLPEDRVFEDVAPRLVDTDGDGRPEAVVVESHAAKGARLAVYNGGGLIAATPYIGRRFRWLAPVGAADFNRDGQMDLAYIETPHLTGQLRVVTRQGDALVPFAGASGLTNHRIGQSQISGGIRDCGRGPEMILTKTPWADDATAEMLAVAVRVPEGQVVARTFTQAFTPANISAALACKIMPDYLD